MTISPEPTREEGAAMEALKIAQESLLDFRAFAWAPGTEPEFVLVCRALIAAHAELATLRHSLAAAMAEGDALKAKLIEIGHETLGCEHDPSQGVPCPVECVPLELADEMIGEIKRRGRDSDELSEMEDYLPTPPEETGESRRDVVLDLLRDRTELYAARRARDDAQVMLRAALAGRWGRALETDDAKETKPVVLLRGCMLFDDGTGLPKLTPAARAALGGGK